MNLTILLFGISTDLIGEKSIFFSVSPSATVLEFKVLFQKKYPQLKEINSYAIAINESYASNETVLKENDMVAVIPPVSGG